MWFETGSPCLLTLVPPLDRGLAAGTMPKGMNVPSFGGGSVTLLGPSSCLCRKGIDPAALPAPPCSEGERRALPAGAAVAMASALSRRETSPCCRWGPGGGAVSVPVTLVRAVSRLSLFKDSSHTCPLRMAVRVRPLACLKYSESARVVAASELKVVFRLQWRAMGQPWGVGSKQENPVCALRIFTQLSPDASGKPPLGGGSCSVPLSLVKSGSEGRRQVDLSASCRCNGGFPLSWGSEIRLSPRMYGFGLRSPDGGTRLTEPWGQPTDADTGVNQVLETSDKDFKTI